MMGRRKAAIGVDIGGTKISAGIVGGEGLVYASPCTIATNPKEPGEVIIANKQTDILKMKIKSK